MSTHDLFATHPDLAGMDGRDDGGFGKVADMIGKYEITGDDRAAWIDRYFDLTSRRELRGGRWVLTRPRITCACGKQVVRKVDGQPAAHACSAGAAAASGATEDKVR